jgi:hypothetical protein
MPNAASRACSGFLPCKLFSFDAQVGKALTRLTQGLISVIHETRRLSP